MNVAAFDPALTQALKQLFTAEWKIRPFGKGDYLFRKGEPADNIFWLQSGKVQVGKLISDGRELTIRVSKKQDMLIKMTLFEDHAVYMMNVKPIEYGEAWTIPRWELEQLLSASPELMVLWLRYTQTEHFRTQSKLRDLVLNGKKGGVYSTLIRIGNTFGKPTKDGLFLDVR